MSVDIDTLQIEFDARRSVLEDQIRVEAIERRHRAQQQLIALATDLTCQQMGYALYAILAGALRP